MPETDADKIYPRQLAPFRGSPWRSITLKQLFIKSIEGSEPLVSGKTWRLKNRNSCLVTHVVFVPILLV